MPHRPAPECTRKYMRRDQSAEDFTAGCLLLVTASVIFLAAAAAVAIIYGLK